MAAPIITNSDPGSAAPSTGDPVTTGAGFGLTASTAVPGAGLFAPTSGARTHQAPPGS